MKILRILTSPVVVVLSGVLTIFGLIMLFLEAFSDVAEDPFADCGLREAMIEIINIPYTMLKSYINHSKLFIE